MKCVMQVNPFTQVPVAKTQAPATLQTSLQPAVVAAGATGAVSRMITAQAAPPTGKLDNSRSGQNSTNTAQSVDPTANMLTARGNGPIRAARGATIDVRV